MQRTNAKDDAIEGGEDGERPPSSQPIAPAVAGQAPPQPAEKSIAYFTEGRGNAGQNRKERPNAVWPPESERMHEKPDKSLKPAELFRRGKEIAQAIRGRIEETRTYYLGRSSREPAQPLSEVFDPMRGPIIPYFVNVIRMLTLPQAYLALRQSAALKEFERESANTLGALRRLSIDLAPLLDADDRQPAIGRSLKLSIYFFRVATGRFFRYLVRRRSTLHRLLRNQINEGFVLYVANRLLNDIAKAFEVRERQLRGESAAVEHEFFTSQFERIARKIEIEHERTRKRIEETNGLVQKILSAIAKALPFLRDRHRYKVPVKVAAAAMGISTRELYRILNHKVEAPDGFPGLDDEVRFYHWVANYRKRIGLQSAIQEKAETIRKWGRQVSVR